MSSPIVKIEERDHAVSSAMMNMSVVPVSNSPTAASVYSQRVASPMSPTMTSYGSVAQVPGTIGVHTTNLSPAVETSHTMVTQPAPHMPQPCLPLGPHHTTMPSATPSNPTVIMKTCKKSKKSQVTVTMATAASATPSNGNTGSQGENTGRWTAEEHRLFLQGLEQHGKGWKKIASLIKSRTVVQIRTHAQKYFQKLAKARQNGEEGDVSMEGRGGSTSMSIGSTSIANMPAQPKRRRQTSGTKRKVISNVVNSAMRENKRSVSEGSLPSVAPALAPFVVQAPLPQPSNTLQNAQMICPPAPALPSITTANGTISGAALEDSLFRFLTPMSTECIQTIAAPAPAPQVNDVARLAGANPITLPSDCTKSPNYYGGEVSPTGVADMHVYPSWVASTAEPPAWYAKGSDVDELLNEADALDWLADSGDLTEAYNPTSVPDTHDHNQMYVPNENHQLNTYVHVSENAHTNNHDAHVSFPTVNSNAVSTPPHISSEATNIPPLPCLFESSDSIASGKKSKTPNLSAASLFGAAADSTDVSENFPVFDTNFDEQAFVSSFLDNNEPSNSFSVLQ